jgi:VWFA-related protein
MNPHSSFTFKLFALLVLIMLTLAWTAPAISQTNLVIAVNEVDNRLFPDVGLIVSVSSGQDLPIGGLDASSFELTEDGHKVTGLQSTPIYRNPLSIVFLIDSSKSMGYNPKPTNLQNVATAAQALVNNSLADTDQIAVLSYSDEVELLQTFTSDKTLVNTALGNLVPKENATFNDAMMEAVELLKPLTSKRVLVVVTDGPDSQLSKHTLEQVIDEVLRSKVIVYTIGWGGADPADLKNLAELTFGEAQYIRGDHPELADLQAAFNVIAQQLTPLREQYQLKFKSSLPADNLEHELVVKVNHLGNLAEATARLTAIPREVTITLPDLQEGQAVGGTVRFAPEVIAPASLAQVDITIDGQPLQSLKAEPFIYAWDASSVNPGVHEFGITAQDTAGNIGQMTIHLDVQAPITVAILQPAANATIDTPTKIVVEVAALAKIARVDIVVDQAAVASLDTAPFEFEMDPSQYQAGVHHIQVTALDVNNYSAQASTTVNIAPGGGAGIGWLAIIAVLAFAGILIPLGLRSRRRVKVAMQNEASIPEPAPSASVGQAVLHEIDGLSPGQIWPLTTAETRLGRKRDENDIPLKGLGASRHHAVIRQSEDHFEILALNPQNPIIVNEKEITQQYILKPGDEIRAGDTVFRFEIS